MGTSYNFSYATSGYPAPTFLVTSGALPGGLTLSSSGAISGAPTAVGTFTGTVTANNGNDPAAAQNFSIFVTEAFSEWAAAAFNSQAPTIGGPDDDPQEDGVSNLLKYLFDIDPTASMTAPDRAALPVVGTMTVGKTSYLTLTYRENPTTTGITVNVQTSPDLQVWTTVTSPTIIQTGTDSTTGDPILQVSVLATTSEEFIRLNVTMP
jgi:hypothetical protein